MDGLTQEQIRFLDDYAFDERSMDALMKDYQITPRKLREWRSNPVFAQELESVNEFLSFARVCNIRKGAMDYTRRSRWGINGELRQLGARQAREGRKLLEWAQKMEPHLIERRGAKKVIFVNPVHPAFADSAFGLLKRLEELQAKAEAARKARAKPKQLTETSPPVVEAEE